MTGAEDKGDKATGGRRQWLSPVVVILGGVLMLTMLQRQLIYYPETARLEDLSSYAAAAGFQVWRDSRGDYQGWRPTGRESARNRMLVFHGNAGQALHRDYFAGGLQALGDEWEVFLFEYPGYGPRADSPSAASIKAAAKAALEELLAEDSRPVFLLGESLGSGVASYLAGTFPGQVAGLLLVTPFTSLADVAAVHYPFLPVRTLLSENYDSADALAKYDGPVAFLLAGRDEIVPPRLGQKLYDGYAGRRWLQVQDRAGHNTLDYRPGAGWWSEASSFLLSD